MEDAVLDLIGNTKQLYRTGTIFDLSSICDRTGRVTHDSNRNAIDFRVLILETRFIRSWAKLDHQPNERKRSTNSLSFLTFTFHRKDVPQKRAQTTLNTSITMARRSQIRRQDIVPPDELGQLLAETNFTKREIMGFYRYATSGSETISKTDFGQLCFEHGVKNASLVHRLWKLWDINGDGKLSHFEVVKGLNPILRGDRTQIASFFFELYDIDGNADLTSPELIAVYSDMIHYTEGDDSEGLSAEQRDRLRAWVHEHQNQKGRLDKESFVEAVRTMEEAEEKDSLWSWRTVYYVFLTAWFEMGTSFALPAMGALSDRIQDRFDINDEGIGTLTSAYFFAAMVGPLAGGYAMDKYGPGIVVIGANVIVVLGAMLQAIAKGEDQFWLILIGRLLLGFGGEITPFTTIEILGRLFPDYFGLMVSTTIDR
jgi:Ca2+-binding EF-hand superfamily protein